MKDEINFGKIIAELRKEKGYTQLQLAELMYVTDKTISRWENNSSYLDIETMKKLCVIFDVTMDELYAGKRLNRNIFIKHRRKKRILMAFISLLFLAVVFLAFYFIANYNSIKFYTLYVKNGIFDIRGGYYFNANSRNLFQISKIEYLGDENLDNFYIEIYEEDGLVIYSGVTDTDIYIEIAEEINIDKLYMKVTYSINDNKYEEDFKIENAIRYKNNKFVNLKQDSTKQTESAIKIDDELISLLQELGYELYGNTTYLKEEKHQDNTIKKYFNVSSKYYNEIYQYKNGQRFDITYFLDSDKIRFQLVDIQNTILEEFNYSLAKEESFCLTKRCGKWDKVVEDTKKEIKSLQDIFN